MCILIMRKKILGVVVSNWNWWSRNHAEVDCVGTQCRAFEIRSAHISLSEHQGFVNFPWAVVNKYFTENTITLSKKFMSASWSCCNRVIILYCTGKIRTGLSAFFRLLFVLHTPARNCILENVMRNASGVL